MALKLIHTSDWHLGQAFFGYDREAEHDAFLSWLLETLAAQETDLLLIAGDVFDVANPSAAAQRRFYRFLQAAHQAVPQMQIIVTAGNHDSAARLEAPVPLLEALNTTIIGSVKRTAEGETDWQSLLIPIYNRTGAREALCLAVPYLRQGDYPPAAKTGRAADGEEESTASDEMNESVRSRSEALGDDKMKITLTSRTEIASDNEPEIVVGGKPETTADGISRFYRTLQKEAETQRRPGEALIAMGHLHASGAELSDDDRSERVLLGGLESVPADLFADGLAYTALGHIHKAQRLGARETIRYAGSPLPMSFSEKNYRHQVIAATISDGAFVQAEILEIPVLAPLLRLPQQPEEPAAVLECLEKLPDAAETDDRTAYPYLEVRVLLTEPDPGFRHRVEEALKSKAVRLTSILPSYPQREDETRFRPQTYQELQQMNPLEMLRHAFGRQYGADMPDAFEAMFNEVIQEVQA